MRTMRAHKITHVLDHAGDIHLHLPEHLNRLARVLQRNIRWRRDHHRPRQRHRLYQRQCDVPCPGRQVDHHVVELSPFNEAKELANDLVQHRPAPDHRLVARIEEPNGNHFQPKGFDRLNAVLAHHARLRVRAQHQRYVRPIHVGIKQSDLVSHLGQRHRQVHRQRGLADASLARPHRNNGVDSRQRLRPLLGGPRSMLMRRMCAQRISS